ncbi:ester cyclase [Sphingomonas faeni]|uniref:ester cyclase n=1 Tax=Sphingomonas faeni TaxID=185950 RepID=UPI0020BF20F0|nr:ester cyclase [Sphingomonas faeni]MCK8455630.1 ester cyclase [Sphingomonas faeni]
MKPLLRLIALFCLCVGYALPAQAAVTITFWSHELGNSFPHAFFTLRGVPDAGGAPVDTNAGFTAKSVSPALLMGPVAGKLDIARPSYVASSDAQFSVVMTDAQYVAVLRLVEAWSEGKPDSVYRLGDHNCVHFVKEAARLVGLSALDQPGLMKKPRSYLKAVLAGNAGRVTPIEMHGRQYLTSLGPIESPGVAVATGAAASGMVTTTVPGPLPAAR